MGHLSCIQSLSLVSIRIWDDSAHRDLLLGGYPLGDVVGIMSNTCLCRKDEESAIYLDVP